MEITKLSTRAKKFFDLIEFDEEEQLICEVGKHPVGLYIIYAVGTTVALLLFSVLVLAPLLLNDGGLLAELNMAALRPILVVIGLLLTILSFGAIWVSAYMYKSNLMLVTSDKVAQLLYKSLFDRQVSQLSIGDVQDVNVSQTGIMARMFNYGTITIETAGEQQNYTFTYTPNPYEVAKEIVGAHERNLKQYGN